VLGSGAGRVLDAASTRAAPVGGGPPEADAAEAAAEVAVASTTTTPSMCVIGLLGCCPPWTVQK